MAKKQQPKHYTIKQILDYMDCSLCYHLKYEKKLPPPEGALVEDKNILYQECIKEAISFYYSEHMQGRPPTLKAVYDKYYALWMEKTGTTERNSIFTRTFEESSKHGREERSRYITKGYETLQRFYKANAKKKQSVLAVNFPYEINLGSVIIAGEFELIREVIGEESKRREIEIVSFQTSTRKPDDGVLAHDLTLSTMAYAFMQTFKVAPDKFLLHYINREEFVSVERDGAEFRRMMAVLDGFVQSVDTIKPYPRPGAHRLFSPYKRYCDTYTY